MSDTQKVKIGAFARGFFSVFDRDTEMTVSIWADTFRRLSQSASAEPGPWRTSRAPYLRDVMDDLSVTSVVEDITVMKGAQLGFSETGSNWIGYIMDYAPAPTLLVQPTVDIGKRFSRQRIAPLISETPKLAQKVLENKSRDASNTQMSKEFPGGILLIAGANSAAGLRSMPIKYLFLDEVDAYPDDCDGEGDPVRLAVARTRTFSRRKVYKVSTPTLAGVSRIEQDYLAGDQRKYHVPCPHCGELHTLEWENVVIPADEDTGELNPRQAHMKCPKCEGAIHEHHKTEMLRHEHDGGRAKWMPTAEHNLDRKKKSYYISSLYSPVGWFSWGEAAEMWLDAKGNPSAMKTFVNTVLGLPYDDTGERVNENSLMERAEPYDKSMLPDGVLVLTCGIDTQPDRLEMEVIGWGVGEENWSIDYHVIHGDPNEKLVWQQLDLYLSTEYHHPNGIKLKVARAFIDAMGANTKAVYEYTRQRMGAGIFPCRGIGGDGVPAVRSPSVKVGSQNDRPWLVGINMLKDALYGRLRIDEYGPGYCHFPVRYELRYYEGLASEEVMVRMKGGRPVREYYVLPGRRNEPLDTRIYGTAAFVSMNLNLEQLAKIFEGSYQVETPTRKLRGAM